MSVKLCYSLWICRCLHEEHLHRSGCHFAPNDYIQDSQMRLTQSCFYLHLASCSTAVHVCVYLVSGKRWILCRKSHTVVLWLWHFDPRGWLSNTQRSRGTYKKILGWERHRAKIYRVALETWRKQKNVKKREKMHKDSVGQSKKEHWKNTRRSTAFSIQLDISDPMESLAKPGEKSSLKDQVDWTPK